MKRSDPVFRKLADGLIPSAWSSLSDALRDDVIDTMWSGDYDLAVSVLAAAPSADPALTAEARVALSSLSAA